tara:strand:+ start:1067 stop:1195 length:129 start_codon:yes stop_codon:yes gene_type:complete
MIYQNDDDEFKRAAEIMIHVIVGGTMVFILGGIGFGLYLIFG